MDIIDGKAKIIYKNNKAYGIRDDGGFLFFFSDIHKWTGQDERYRLEIEQQLKLADFLLDALNKEFEKQEAIANDLHNAAPAIYGIQ